MPAWAEGAADAADAVGAVGAVQGGYLWGPDSGTLSREYGSELGSRSH